VNYGDKNLNCFKVTLEAISEQQDLCWNRECTGQYSIFFDSQVLDRALCISVSLPEDKFTILIYKYILTERNMG
jgi:high-affinity Fe2+/Pb2+ permease